MTRTTTRVAVLAAAIALAAGGCGGDDDAPASLGVATYNAGLAVGFVDYAEERAPAIMAALPGVDADVICAQEFWEQRFWDQAVGALASTHPYAHRLAPMQDLAPAACGPGDLDALEACVQMFCASMPPEMLANCALANCRADLGALESACQSCLIANVGTGDLPTIRATCEMDDVPVYAYEGSFGTGLLSRHPLAETDALVLDSTANRRAVLYARIDDTDHGTVHVFCTHLTSNLSSVPYTGSAGSWTAEQVAQIQATLAFVETKTAGAGQVVIVGDLNSGPELPGITPELPDNFAMWLAAGLSAPYPAQADAICTFCDDNPLNLGTMGGEGGLIDHVLLRGFAVEAAGGRILDAPITIDVGGAPTATALSDHYGLLVRIGG